MSKLCNKCGEQKPAEEFPVRYNRGKRDRHARCKICFTSDQLKYAPAARERAKRWYRAKAAETPTYGADRSRNYYSLNIEKRRDYERTKQAKRRALKLDAEYRARWKADHPHYDAQRRLAWRRNNPVIAREIDAAWREKNRAEYNANKAGKRAAKRNATPAWANKFFINEAYRLAKLRERITGCKWDVDHIVPLTSKLVCGLHVENNLMVITSSANRSKGNRYFVE
jgi:hypothetical protein